MLPLNIMALAAAAAAAATPVNEVHERGLEGVSSSPSELDSREINIVVGDDTDAAIWAEPGDSELERRQVNYRCFNSGLSLSNVRAQIESACEWLQGGYATNQEKKACRNHSIVDKVNFAIRNTVGGRGHDYDACVDRLSAISQRCPQGGRVNRANWECLVDPNLGRC